MADFGPEIAAEIIAACQAGAAELAEAFGRTFDAPAELTAGESATFDPAAPPEGCEGPGLAVVLVVEGAAAVFVLPEASGLLPEWYAAPDPTGASKLTTFAQELGMLVLPEAFMPSDFRAARVDDLLAAIAGGEPTESAGLVPLTIRGNEKEALAWLVWPLGNAETVLADPSAAEGESPAEAEAESGEVAEPAAPAAPVSAPPSKSAASPNLRVVSLDQLPNYSRSLLRVKVPVTVTLASAPQTADSVLNLVQGAILQFDKSCEDLLDLEVGGHRIAQGEAVKVGEKFGLRIMSIILPDEQFAPVVRS